MGYIAWLYGYIVNINFSPFQKQCHSKSLPGLINTELKEWNFKSMKKKQILFLKFSLNYQFEMTLPTIFNSTIWWLSGNVDSSHG